MSLLYNLIFVSAVFIFFVASSRSVSTHITGSAASSSSRQPPNRKYIPRLIFRTNEDVSYHSLHPKLQEILNETISASTSHSNLQSQYIQVYFSAHDREQFITQYFPQYLSHYVDLLPGAYKADLFRLLALYRYGGIYMDTGMRLLPDIIIDRDIVLHDHDELILLVDAGDLSALANGFLATYPRHPFIAYAIRWIIDNIEHKRYGCNNLDITGPKALGRALHSYLMIKQATESISTTSTVSENTSGVIKTLVEDFGIHNHTYYWKQTSLSSQSDSSTSSMHIRFHHFNHQNQIVTQDNVPLIQNKFPGYHDIVYHTHNQAGDEEHTLPYDKSHHSHGKRSARHNKVAYGIYYYFRKVYASDLGHIHPLANGSEHAHIDDAPNFLAMNPSKHGVYEGSLIQSGGSFWIVMNDTRWGFPNYDTFLAMGMQQCMGCVVKSKEALDLPLGPTLSIEPTAYWQQYGQVLPTAVEDELRQKGEVVIETTKFVSIEEYHKRLVRLQTKYGGHTIDSADFLLVIE